MEIYATRTREGLELSTIDKGYRVSRLYVGYTIREAKKLFREYIKGLK